MRKNLSKEEIKAWLLNEITTLIDSFGEAGEIPSTFTDEERSEIERLKIRFSKRLGPVNWDAEHTAGEKLDSRLTNARY